MANMYEPPKIAESSPSPVMRQRPRYGLALLVVVLLAFIGLGLAWMHQQQQQRLNDLAATVGELQTGTATAAQRSSAEMAALRTSLEAQEAAMAALSSAQLGDRSRLQLALVEHLLLSANERLQLSRDTTGAQLALELADARLALLNEPRLFKLRETIASERGALGRMPRVDHTSALLNLSALIETAPSLPLAARIPDRFEPEPLPQNQASTPAVAPEDAHWLAGAWAQVRQALNAMFSVRKARGPAPRLLAPEQEAQVYQILLLRLESVRVALLRGEQPALREAAASAARWLRQRFHSEDAGVQSELSELQRIGALPLDTPLPDIAGSLQLLRAELGAVRP